MKNLLVCLLSVLLLLPVASAQSSQVYGTDTFRISESSRNRDYGQSGKRVRLFSFDVGSRKIGEAKVSWDDGWLELDTLVVEFFRFHNPKGTLEVSPTVATVADITDIRLENTQGEVVAIGRWETVLPKSWIEEVSTPGSMNQMVFETVQPPKRFRGGTFSISVVPSSAFVTDDVVGAGIRKITIRSKDGTETCEPYPEWGMFISSGATIINPAVLTVAVSSDTHQSVPAMDNVAGARFMVTAKSIRPRSPMLWRGWQLEFAVPHGTALDLGVVKVLNPAGEVIKEETPILKGNNPRLGLLSFIAPDAGRSSGYSLKSEETLTITFSTKAFAGADITITSVTLLVADFGGVNAQYGDLVYTDPSVSTTVHVQESTVPSGGGGGGVPPAQQEPPMVLDEVQMPKVVKATYYTFMSSIFLHLEFDAPIPTEVNYVRWSVLGGSFNVDASFAWGNLYTGSASGDVLGIHVASLPESWEDDSLNELRALLEQTPATLRFYRQHR